LNAVVRDVDVKDFNDKDEQRQEDVRGYDLSLEETAMMWMAAQIFDGSDGTDVDGGLDGHADEGDVNMCLTATKE
jgi:hypothetical protein